MQFICQENRELGKLVVKLQCLVERGLALSAEREVAIVPFPEGVKEDRVTRGLENQQIGIAPYRAVFT